MLSCRFSSYRPFEEQFCERWSGLGQQFVEIHLPPVDQAEQVSDELDTFGLRPSTLHGRLDVTRPDAAQQLEVQLPALKLLGCGIFFTSVKAEDTPLETVAERLYQAGEVAKSAGVMIAIETHPDLAENADVALHTMRAVNHPNVRLNYDTANVYFYNESADAVRDLERVAEYVVAVHLKDTNGGYRDWHFPALGAGVVDFAGIFRVLDAAGYAGPLTLEIEGIEGEEKTPELVSQRVADSVAYLKSLGRA